MVSKGKSSLEHFADQVRTKKIRDCSWAMLSNHLEQFHPVSDSQETWNTLRTWARTNGFLWDWEWRARGKKTEIWITFDVPPASYWKGR